MVSLDFGGYFLLVLRDQQAACYADLVPAARFDYVLARMVACLDLRLCQAIVSSLEGQLDVGDRSDEPQNDQQDCQGTTNAVDARTLERLAQLYSRKCEASRLGRPEPTNECESHASDAGYNSER